MGFDLDPTYKQVPERIADFKAKHPEGVLRPADPSRPYWLETIGDQTYLVYVAAAYRTPDDPTPGIGAAWEPVPGRTPYTKFSELQNAETSAWGRAIVACLASESKSIASAEDVRNRQADHAEPDPPPIPGFRSSLMAATEGLTDAEREVLRGWLAEQGLPDRPSKMNAEQADRVCEYIMHGLPKIETVPA